MSSAENEHTPIDLSLPSTAAVDAISDGLSVVTLETGDLVNPKGPPPSSPPVQSVPPFRPFIAYSRSQLLFLHKSPLVKVPNGMPALKDWFGYATSSPHTQQHSPSSVAERADNDQNNSKKDSDTSASSGNARERRFRRDAEDGTPVRPSFRGTAITQPSQMGNFKHQSIRTTDRDREREVDRDQDRDPKVKEGHERLRNLSDKYDRDRRAISSISQLRSKDREVAPHLVNSTSRVVSQGQQTVGNRATDNREPLKKKDGESAEDWRRGTEPSRAGRERPENGRRERDDRDRDRGRPRSSVRDSSRTRQDSSISRRDRDGDRERRTDREDRLGDGSVGCRRERDDRDNDRESEVDDPRRWRDDGKRDERMAARRDRELRERDREGGTRDRLRSTWENADRSDKRWAADDRDVRGKKTNGRDRRTADDVKDREERKDRDKEPAWMDTYIPTNGNGFGMQRENGELDGIQAFKKELREKEQRNQLLSSNDAEPLSDGAAKPDLPVPNPEGQLDEIQLFRLMMKREEEKRKAESLASSSPRPQDAPENAFPQGAEQKNEIGGNSMMPPSSVPGTTLLNISSAEEGSSDMFKPAPTYDSVSSSSSIPANTNDERVDSLKCANPRSQQPSGSDLSSLDEVVKSPSDGPTVPIQGPQPNAAVGSRLLALASRSSQNTVGPPRSTASQSPVSFPQKNNHVGVNAPVGTGGNFPQTLGDFPTQAPAPTDGLLPHNGFYPFDSHRDGTLQASTSDAAFRSHLAFTGERNPLTQVTSEQASPSEIGVGLPTSTSGQLLDGLNSGIAAAKGSRFAKFFDGKGRDNQVPPPSKGALGNIGSLPPTAAQKVELGGLNHSSNADARAMEGIFAMLNNSAHAQRLNTAPEISNLDHLGSHATGLHALPAQPHQQLQGHGRLDSVYDTCMDDRNFVPDGMVPGLRSVPPPRGRQNGAIFPDIADDNLHFTVQRGSAQMYQGAMSTMHLQHTNVGRGGSHPMQAPYRGGPSPNPLPPAQRLPPGLANLGGRPPHDPNQFLGIANGGIHNTLHANAAPTQQPFTNYQQAANLGFGGPPMRLHHTPPHQLQGALAHNPLQGLVHPGNLGANQAQLLGLAGAGGIPGGLRGHSGGFGQGPQAQPPHLALRQHQQPQQQIPPHMLPLHFQQQALGGANGQSAHDLMALLMSGARRSE
ncbi:hypothetical protein ID866_628 [Astraeus odoratus]|nr:hypothetical protein ID866_628 [Astraeus odoratus]